MSDEQSLSGRLARQARDLMETAGSKGGQLARIDRLQLDILGLKREMQQQLRSLGERTLELVRQGGAAGSPGGSPAPAPTHMRSSKGCQQGRLRLFC